MPPHSPAEFVFADLTDRDQKNAYSAVEEGLTWAYRSNVAFDAIKNGDKMVEIEGVEGRVKAAEYFGIAQYNAGKCLSPSNIGVTLLLRSELQPVLEQPQV